jgi:hypothetical protein
MTTRRAARALVVVVSLTLSPARVSASMAAVTQPTTAR